MLQQLPGVRGAFVLLILGAIIVATAFVWRPGQAQREALEKENAQLRARVERLEGAAATGKTQGTAEDPRVAQLRQELRDLQAKMGEATRPPVQQQPAVTLPDIIEGVWIDAAPAGGEAWSEPVSCIPKVPVGIQPGNRYFFHMEVENRAKDQVLVRWNKDPRRTETHPPRPDSARPSLEQLEQERVWCAEFRSLTGDRAHPVRVHIWWERRK